MTSLVSIFTIFDSINHISGAVAVDTVLGSTATKPICALAVTFATHLVTGVPTW